jgi:hypothetical protein
MKNPIVPALALAFLTAAPLAAARPVASEAPLATPAPLEAQWICKRADNVCGLRDGKQLSNPAKLNYKRCLQATPEYKKMEDEGVRSDSPEGIRLKAAAANRVRQAANTVRQAGGYCSVWKAISHKDGRRIDDLTSRVIAQY